MHYTNLSSQINANTLPRRRRAQPEAQIQRALVERLAWQKPAGVWFCHVGNGGYRRATEASIMAGLGVRRGAPDLIFIVAGRTFGLELKSPRGRLSEAQRECHNEIREAGGMVGVATGIDEAVSLLQSWGILPGAAS
jgi:hypothetical protein